VPFKYLLQELVQHTPGATRAILTDWEGEAVEQFSLFDDEYDLKVLGAHQNIILNRIRDMRHKIPEQTLQEAVITTDRQRLLIGAVGDDYTLVMTMEREAIVARALVQLQRSVRLLEKEIY
jgi:predicted regulator of Ras-like GTPase activity (Roadblock/LC7/MglB family)